MFDNDLYLCTVTHSDTMKAQSTEVLYHTEEERILTEITELQKDLEAIRRLRSRVLNNGAHLNGKEIQSIENIPQYDSKLGWRQKCLFVLGQMQKAFSDEVATKISKLEPTLKEGKVLDAVRYNLSKLYVAKEITAKRYGKKLKYDITKPKEKNG